MPNNHHYKLSDLSFSCSCVLCRVLLRWINTYYLCAVCRVRALVCMDISVKCFIVFIQCFNVLVCNFGSRVLL